MTSGSRSAVLGGLVLAMAGWLVPRGARACSCMAPPPPQAALSEADAVFEARPFSLSTDARSARYDFEVDRVWKGEVPTHVEITTALHSAACGRSYQIGTRYVIYARRKTNGDLSDNLCSRTRTSQAAAEDLSVLGVGRAPLDPQAPPPGSSESTEPPRIEPLPPEPPPVTPRRRGCAVENPHDSEHGLPFVLLGIAVAIRRRRAVGSAPARPASRRR